MLNVVYSHFKYHTNDMFGSSSGKIGEDGLEKGDSC